MSKDEKHLHINFLEIKENIQTSFYYSKLVDLYYNIKNGIHNIITYLPIIWNDRQWDDYYFHNLIRFKLIQMEKCIRNGYSANADKDADNIQHTIDLLNRITEQNNFSYLEESLKPFYERYPDYEFKREFEQCKDNPKFYRMIDNDTEEQSQLLHECYKKEDEMQKQDLDELYSFLRQHIREWWD